VRRNTESGRKASASGGSAEERALAAVTANELEYIFNLPLVLYVKTFLKERRSFNIGFKLLIL